ncbi:putative lysine-specific demethylase JMJ16 [Chlorella vulgaris]
MAFSVLGAAEALPVGDQAAALAPGSDAENADPQEASGSLKRMWQQQEVIGTHRTDNLFQSLEERTLTEDEQRIIEQRVALQRRMYGEYERRERQRKVAEVLEVCPDLTEKQAGAALDMCDGREEDAAAQLVSDPAFRQRALAACIPMPAQAAAAVVEASPPRRDATRQSHRHSKPAGPRPKIVDPASLGGNVFVGAFRGKGFKPPPKGRVRKPSTSSRQQRQEEEEEEEEEMEEEEQETEQEGKEQEQEEEEEQAVQGPAPQCSDGEQQVPEVAVKQAVPVQQVEAQQPCPGVLLWPEAQAAAVGAAQKLQRYVLVQADTLQAPTDSLLRAARRQLGEPSDSRGAPGFSAAAEGPPPTSVARSRPRHDALEAGTDGAGAEACLSLLSADAAECQAVVAQAAGVQQLQQVGASHQERRKGLAAAAGAQPAATCAAAAESDEETETDGETESEAEPSQADSDEAISSDDDMVKRRRQTRKAPAQLAKPLGARPSRAAKQTAAAVLLAYADSGAGSSSDEELSVTDASSASSGDDEAQPGRRSRPKARRSSSGAVPAHVPAEQAVGSSRKAPASKRQKLDSTAAAAAPAAAAAAAAPAQQASSAQQAGGSDSADDALQQQPSQGMLPGAGTLPAVALPPRVRAISSTGHTCRGRVKQKSHKSADLVVAGSLRAEKGWYNAGYIFPQGFQSRTLFRSSVAIDQLCVHECHVVGKGGQYWPQPTFKVVATDRPNEPLIAKSCTGCWTGILKRINAEIEARRRAGEDLPPPPKTAIAGPEYFGFNQPNIQEAVEGLDPDHLCIEYWAGKAERQRAAAGLPYNSAAPARAARAPRAPSNGGTKRSGGGGGGGSKGRGRRRDGSDTEDDEQGGAGEEDETQFMTNKWSAVSRGDRYRKRLQENGDDTSALDHDNPLPHFIDPITMGAVVRPAISPYGHVAGLATWKVVLVEKQQCPFTNQPLQFEQLKVLTKTNIHLHREKIVNGNIHGRSAAM